MRLPAIMIRFLCDEDFNNRILRGLLRRQPDLDIVRVQDTHLPGMSDALVLEWAAQERRVLLTHDVSTVTRFAFDRIREGKIMAGVIEVAQATPIRVAIEDLLLIALACHPEELENHIEYLPL